MKDIRFDWNAGVDDGEKRFRIVKATMDDIIAAGGLAIGEKAIFYDPEIMYFRWTGYLTWYGIELIIELV